MNLGRGFLPRIDARNYKAVERCLPRDGPGLFNVGLDLPWAIRHFGSERGLTIGQGGSASA